MPSQFDDVSCGILVVYVCVSLSVSLSVVSLVLKLKPYTLNNSALEPEQTRLSLWVEGLGWFSVQG